MAFSRALVVDDSQTARHSLAKLLAQHDLEVAFAESGEAALHFLQHELVDVIFMDHTMPGMDGLEAVRAIKGNPRTATIPVMMYTTKEGEVYVSQARALGAVGVLPKQFQPGLLFDMLKKLGLVHDRRDGDVVDVDAPRRRLTDAAEAAEHAYEQQALGVSVQTLIGRVLEEQHLKLRADILGSHRRFARQVASEILGRDLDDAGGSPARLPRTLAALPRPPAVAAMLLLTAAMALAGYAWQLRAERAAAELEIARMTTASRNELELLYSRANGLDATLRDRDRAEREHQRAALDALAWAVNQTPHVDFDDAPFGDTAEGLLGELVPMLDAMGFRGRLQLTAYLAPFCLARDASGRLHPAPADLPVDGCEVVGHPLEAATIEGLQSVSFAAALAEAEAHPDVDIRLAVHGPEQQLAANPPPSNLLHAGEWNRLAAAANRLGISLEPYPPRDVVQR